MEEPTMAKKRSNRRNWKSDPKSSDVTPKEVQTVESEPESAPEKGGFHAQIPEENPANHVDELEILKDKIVLEAVELSRGQKFSCFHLFELAKQYRKLTEN